MPQQEISSKEMYGISKRINDELEALPLHTHSAICEMVRVGMQHRNLVEQKAEKDRQQDQQERVIRIREAEMERERNAAAIAGLGPLPVKTDPAPN